MTTSEADRWSGDEVGKAALIALVARYSERAVGVSLIEVQKLMYFLQVAGEPLRLQFTKGIYGPYAENLRFVLLAVEGHFLSGFGGGSRPVTSAEPISVVEGAASKADVVVASHPETRQRIERVLDLADGFESAYGMELLSTVHWVIEEGSVPTADPKTVASHVAGWSTRKKNLFGPDHVAAAWHQLRDHRWLESRAS